MNPIWIGKFEVSASPDNEFLQGDAGAFVWIAAQAEDEAKLRLRVDDAMQKLGLTVVDGQELQEVVSEDDLTEALGDLIPEARRNVESVVCGTWHRFKHQDV